MRVATLKLNSVNHFACFKGNFGASINALLNRFTVRTNSPPNRIERVK